MQDTLRSITEYTSEKEIEFLIRGNNHCSKNCAYLMSRFRPLILRKLDKRNEKRKNGRRLLEKDGLYRLLHTQRSNFY